jgi:signal transduction histidine kinase
VSTPPLRVLVVEDNPGDVRLIEEMLAEAEPRRWVMETADRLDGALGKLSEGGFSAVLLDLRLPDSQGVEAVARVCELAAEAAVVVLTGTSDERLATDAIRYGAQDYLVKGATDARLLDRILRYSLQRKQLEDQLRQTQKMDAVGRLAGGVAHDFNNMLAVILGQAELLLRRGDAPEPAARGLREIRKAAERAANLTRQLLAFSRKQILHPQVLDLNEVVTGIESMLQRLIGEDVRLVTALKPEVGRVKADPGQIDQVILNLAINARDAMPGGGTLTIETDRVELDDAYARLHEGAAPGRYGMLAVTDTGVGMDAATLKRVFEPFFTTKELGHGTGLGLATVYGIVKQSGGFVWVYSEPRHGTTFKVFLPQVDVPAPEPGQEVRRPVGGTETILVVEDEELLRDVLEDMLRESGYTVLAAAGPEDAVERVRNGLRVDLVLTDVVMPGMNGRELAERIQSLSPESKVLFMSGYTDDAVLRLGILDAHLPLLHKPFGLETLLDKVREALGPVVSGATPSEDAD